MKQVVGFEKYLIDEDGNVFGPKKQLKKQLHSSGFLMVSIDSKLRVLHMLMARTYIPNPNGYTHVSHIDGNVQNNNIHNLEWVTVKELRRRKKLHPTKPRDEKEDIHTEGQQRQIVKLHRSKPKYTVSYLSKLIDCDEKIIKQYIAKYKRKVI